MDAVRRQARQAGLLNVLNEIAALTLVGSVAGVLEIAEVPMILWLASWGATTRSAGAAAAP